MSIKLMAYPMGFLIEPEKAKIVDVEKKTKNTQIDNKDYDTLKSVVVLTNMDKFEFQRLVHKINAKVVSGHSVLLCNVGDNQMYFSTEIRDDNIFAIKLLNNTENELFKSLGEEFFKNLDVLAQRNVRLLNGTEFFYYNYSTKYKEEKEIYENLKSNNAQNINSTNEGIGANVDGQNVKYRKDNDNEYYNLEVEQKIKIVDIGITSRDISQSYRQTGLTDLKIKTNIKKDELRNYLAQTNYTYISANGEMPLKNSNATLNWVLENGYYTAYFSGINNEAITKEAEIIFNKLNKAASRDLRYINDLSIAIYTYTTNYTDKDILINTITEHGATNISENADIIDCELYGMKMKYYKTGDDNGYKLDITQISDKKLCEDTIKDINDEYGLNIQELTYNKIKERLKEENLTLETEEVLDDNSIVLTIEV